MNDYMGERAQQLAYTLGVLTQMVVETPGAREAIQARIKARLADSGINPSREHRAAYESIAKGLEAAL